MEEMSPSLSVALNVGTSLCETSATSMEVTCLAASLLGNPVTQNTSLCTGVCSISEHAVNSAVETSRKDSSGGANILESVPELRDAPMNESEEDEVLSIGDETCGIIADELLALASGSEVALEDNGVIIKPMKIDQVPAEAVILSSTVSGKVTGVDVFVETVPEVGESVQEAKVEVELSKEKNLGKGGKSVYELDCVPLWGSVSICGKRPEMEDAVQAIPQFMKVPIKMLIAEQAVEGISQNLTHITSHFFGVYDGHGGPQVADYCRDHIHLALVEEIGRMKDNVRNGSVVGDIRQLVWESAFTNCFKRVDTEISGLAGGDMTCCEKGDSSMISGPLAAETVGSTAVVALVCSSHIIVANCGDSRAVLLRGKDSIPLSVDHKPDNKEEYERIEAAGGKVIQWNGYRVFGVLAMSRSIGDRYLKPWIIHKPDVMLIPRARDDECLILASDGLWDVMTNDEACEVARRRILLWHKKNGVLPLAERGKGIDPAAQAAAQYLSMLAIEKGSKDNISVIVVDLKAQRKFKTKPGGESPQVAC
ncbi:hypothetical protein MLD38_007876 [Melastoma candidum]|uniref:Uncharacterized protein n=1 Tax=Melastoma candidum TaxID=119954 RepID=A0ACB9RT20_9MYRT|nr:hypothetical protein MLD38_007876 [Melastoma candidum]